MIFKGTKVRKLKESGTASKEEISAEVATLLSLKGQLAAAQGVDPAAGGKEKKKKKGGGPGKEEAKAPPTSAAAAPATAVNPTEVERLQGLVTQQVWILLISTFSFLSLLPFSYAFSYL